MQERRSRIWLVVALSVACGSPEAAPPPPPVAPVAPVPPVVPPPVPTPVLAPPIAAPPVVAVAPSVPAAAVLGTGDVIPFAPTPPAAGPAIEPIEGVEWDAFRALLAATTPISRGTRSGYRALSAATLEGDIAYWIPAIYTAGHTEQSTRPAWWRPAPGMTLLVVPYSLLGRNGGVGLGIFEPAAGGVRYVRHLAEQQTDEGGCTPVANTIGATRDGMEWRRLVTCEYGGAVVSVRFRDGAVEIREQTLGDHAEPSGTWAVVGADGTAVAPVAAPAAPVAMPEGADLALAAVCCTVADDRCPGPFGSFDAACAVLAGTPRCDSCAREWGEYGYDGDALDDLRESCPSCR